MGLDVQDNLIIGTMEIQNERVLIYWESYEKALSITQQTRDSGSYLLSSLRTAWEIHDWCPEKSSCHIFLYLFLYSCFLSHKMIIFTFSFGPPVTAAVLIEGEVIEHITEPSDNFIVNDAI